MSVTNTMSCFGYFVQGLKMITLPQLRWFVLIPILINTLVFLGMITWVSGYFAFWMNQMTSWMPEWLSFLELLLWPFFLLAVMAVGFFTFTIVGNFIAAPFNALLAERVQRMEGANFPDMQLKDFLIIVPRSIDRELRKLLYYLPRLLVLLLLSFIPVVGIVLWFVFNGWMMAVQYCDYAADNRALSFIEMKRQLKKNLPRSWYFGAVINLAIMIPLLNLLVIPAAVIGATLFWEREMSEFDLKNL